MNLDEAGRLQMAWETKHGDKPCHHTRVIDFLFEQDGQAKCGLSRMWDHLS